MKRRPPPDNGDTYVVLTLAAVILVFGICSKFLRYTECRHYGFSVFYCLSGAGR